MYLCDDHVFRETNIININFYSFGITEMIL